ncbi:Protein McrC [bioreactor metagenome]|uniref:Protein McrC n=1 Tax=bioreactor metagenome TaxID=1076179 RepID=A0A644ZLG5_9ZZZZ
MTTEEGDLTLSSFIDDMRMHKLFEKFILEFYKKEYPQIKVHSPRIDWALDDSNAIMLPVMQSDITLTKGNQTLIIDAKYYSRILQGYRSHSSLRSGHLYQIFTYVKNKSLEFKETQQQVSGMLLYAKTTEELQPDIVYGMSGNKIGIKSLDLNQEFPYIVNQLHTIVAEHFPLY